jgi:hypothetical protein
MRDEIRRIDLADPVDLAAVPQLVEAMDKLYFDRKGHGVVVSKIAMSGVMRLRRLTLL